MAKQVSKGKDKATVVQAATVVSKGKASPGIITVVNKAAKLRGARQAWYEVLCKYDGKPAAEFLAATTENPPSLPKSKIPEKATGWLSWFTRSGIATVAESAKA